MNSAGTLIRELSRPGVSMNRDGDRLVLDGPEAAITAALVERVRAFKGEILRTLKTWDRQDWRTFFDERAGIVEYEAGISRRQAEDAAFADCVHRWLAMHPPANDSLESCAYCGRRRGNAGPDSIP